MSSTPIYDELAATYLADLTPEPHEPAGPDQPDRSGRPPTPPTDRAKTRTQARKRSKA